MPKTGKTRETAAEGQTNLEKFRRLLETRGLKLTSERRTLLSEIEKTREHFDADELYAQLKERGVQIARDTVYRNLPLLLECGVLQKSAGSGRRDYFERVTVRGHHDHAICVNCGTIAEFHSEQIEQLQRQLCEEMGFRLLFHDHRLFGHCAKCAHTSHAALRPH